MKEPASLAFLAGQTTVREYRRDCEWNVTPASILVTGGAGYIGSIVTKELIMRGYTVVVFDNLARGHKAAIHPQATLVKGDLSNTRTVKVLFDAHNFDAVMHFASNALVGESMEYPLMYIDDNVTNGLNLLREAVAHGVRRFILSSSANLFGDPQRMPIDEQEPISPSSPYGESKHILERILHWMDRIYNFRYASLRYFNAAGAALLGDRGEDHNPETHLIPLTLQVALGQREKITIFGDDYPTRDGSCIRDYIHVIDLAQAHILALQALDEGSRIYNLGSGQGSTVKEVIETCRRVTDRHIPMEVGPRRPGDPATLIASSRKIRRELGWRQQYSHLRTIIDHAWKWHFKHPYGYGG